MLPEVVYILLFLTIEDVDLRYLLVPRRLDMNEVR